MVELRVRKESRNFLAKRLDAGERSALECTASELTESALQGIEPGCAGWGEMQEDTRTLGQDFF
jgi:hypothetical protein